MIGIAHLDSGTLHYARDRRHDTLYCGNQYTSLDVDQGSSAGRLELAKK
jgi:hypothetical protein